jgi:hypothetical protein
MQPEPPPENTERLTRIEELFHAARGRDSSQRAAFLDGACGGDLELRSAVEALLIHDRRAPGKARDCLAEDSREPLEARGALQEGPGSRIGPYKLLQELGEGGFGVVYMAEQREPVKRRVALKGS